MSNNGVQRGLERMYQGVERTVAVVGHGRPMVSNFFERITELEAENAQLRQSLRTNGMNTIYLCDRKACEQCHWPDCKHTKRIEHAVNFKMLETTEQQEEDEYYIEKEEDER